MAMEERNSRQYAYAYFGKRKSGTSIRKYLGTGIIGLWLHAHANKQREVRRRQRQLEHGERKEIAAAVKLSCHTITFVNKTITAEMASRGFFQHHRSEWRKRSVGKGSKASHSRDQDLAPTDSAAASWDQCDTHASLAADAFSGLQLAIDSWLAVLSGSDSANAATLRGRLEPWRAELLADGASPLEKLCAERALLCRVEVEVVAAKYLGNPVTSHQHATHMTERCHAARCRLSAAIRTLEEVRHVISRSANHDS